MEYRQLGACGLRLSVMGLGSWLTIGHHVDDEVAARQISLCFEQGVNWLDTADAYNTGGAEAAFGRLLAGYRRESYVLATKAWAPMSEAPTDRGLSAKHLREACEASLRRLGTDYVDLYQCHRPDPLTPIAETVRAMDDLARAGKIIYWGVSEWSGWQIMEAVKVAEQLGCRPPVSNQPRYSLLWRRQCEEDTFPCTQHLGLGNVVFSPLAHGVLTGKYQPGAPPPAESRAADDSKNSIMRNLYLAEENLRRAQRVRELAEELGASAAQLALRWCLRHPAVTAVILGANKVSHLADNLKAADLTVPDEVMTEIDELFALDKPAAP
ncbi:MAG: aldo/keto reductase family protein [Armatimonadetes bacterium]|nr:aldo/keto reductase family protein [Armatimonadota bacterium]